MAKPTNPESGSLIDRFNRRREKVAAEARSDQTDEEHLVSEELGETDVAGEEDALSDSELLEKYELPDPETVEDEAGLDRFFEGNMPERLRRLALRRVWRLNPLFRFADEMVEYGEDYTDAATVVEGMQTAYQVGKGYLKKANEALGGDSVDDEAGEDDNPDEASETDRSGAQEADEESKTNPDDAGEEAARNAPERGDNPSSTQGLPDDGLNNRTGRNFDVTERYDEAPRKLSHSDLREIPQQEPSIQADDRSPAGEGVNGTTVENTEKQEVRPKRMVFRKLS